MNAMQLEHGAWELRLGDCLDPVTGLPGLADGCAEHVITDPPYEAEAHTLQRRTKGVFGAPKLQGGGKDIRPAALRPVGFDPITESVRAGSAAQFARAATRWVLVFCQAEAVGLWRSDLVAGGAVFKRACIWVKPDGQPQLTGDRPGMGYESIVAAHSEGGRSRWNGGGSHGVFSCATKSDPDSMRTGHPTQKPLALMETLVSLFTDPGDLILDPFAGSGTTGVACIRLGRRFLGWERDPKFHAAAVKRLSAAREQGNLFAKAKRPREEQADMFKVAKVRP